MQKTRAKLPVFLIIISVLTSCVLRFFLLLRCTDLKTGYVKEGTMVHIVIYALLFLIAILSAVYVRGESTQVNLLSFDTNAKTQRITSLILAFSMFVDFIHQSYGCFSQLSDKSGSDITYMLILAVSSLSALASSFYFVCYSMTASGSNYDFRNLKVIHFAPVIWCLVRLLIMLVRITELVKDAESSLELVFLAFAIMFFLFFVLVIDKDGESSRTIVFFSLCTFLSSVVVVLPRLMLFIVGRSSLLPSVTYTMLSYFSIGIFSLFFISKRD